jgi:hypothetical protein
VFTESRKLNSNLDLVKILLILIYFSDYDAIRALDLKYEKPKWNPDVGKCMTSWDYLQI